MPHPQSNACIYWYNHKESHISEVWVVLFLMLNPTSENWFSAKLKHASKFALEQLGYHCRSETFTWSANKPAILSLFAGFGAFFLSLISANETDFVSLLENVLAAILAFVPTWLMHCATIKSHNECSDPSNIPVPVSASRTPYGSQFLIYIVLAVYSFLALGYRLIFGGEFAIWIINFTVFFIECVGIVIDILVIVFDAEIKVD